MNQSQLILFIIGALVQYGLPALDKIIELVRKYDGATTVPEDEWRKLFDRIKRLDYWDYVPKP